MQPIGNEDTGSDEQVGHRFKDDLLDAESLFAHRTDGLGIERGSCGEWANDSVENRFDLVLPRLPVFDRSKVRDRPSAILEKLKCQAVQMPLKLIGGVTPFDPALEYRKVLNLGKGTFRCPYADDY